MPWLLHCPFYGKIAVLIQLHDLIDTVALKLNLQHHRGIFSWLLMDPLLISTYQSWVAYR